MKKLEFKLDKVMFKSKDNGFTICRVFPINDISSVNVNKYGTVSLKGMMCDLINDVEYECIITDEEDNQYGTTYEVSGVRPLGIGSIDTDDEMLMFIRAMVGHGVYDKLKNTTNICNIIKNKDVVRLTKIKGIGKKVANKILNAWQRDGINSKFISELLNMGFNEEHIDKITNQYKELHLAIDIINDNPYRLILDDVNIKITIIDSVALKMNIESSDIRRIQAYVYKSIKDESVRDYKSHIEIDLLKNNKTIKSIINKVGEEKYMDALELLKSEKLIIQIGCNIGLYSIYIREKRLIHEINRIANCKNEFTTGDIDREIDEEESEIGFKLTYNQRYAVKSSILNNFTLIKGHAGTGKTTITRIILNILERLNKNISIKQCALSGKAAQVLSNATGREASTIHKLLEVRDFNSGEQRKIFTDVLVIDELSMVDIVLFKNILELVRDGVKIICMGDSNQLPSLAYGKLIDDISMFKGVNVVNLTEVHRQALESGIISVANMTREGKQFVDKSGEIILGNMRDMNIHSDCDVVEKTVSKTIELYDETNKEKVQVICATSATCYDVNKRVQNKIIDTSGEFITVNAYGNIHKHRDKPAKYRIFKNDKIMIIKNMYNVETKEEYLKGVFLDENENKNNLYNGNIGTLTEIHKEYVVVEINNNEYVIEEGEYDNIQLSYACTCHKLQGSSADDVIICMIGGYAESYLMCNEWIYTAITRSKNSCYLYGGFENIVRSVNVRNMNKKTTFMELLLK